MTRIRVPIVIPTRNAGTTLGAVLSAIAQQDGDVIPEIVAIDSGSTDETLTVLDESGATVVTVASDRFNHGGTRNEALQRVAGEFAVLLVQDAVPASRSWLSALIAPLQRDGAIAGTFARQVPADGASRITAHYLDQWVAARPAARTVGPLTGEDLAGMSPAERHCVCAFDNVCSCIRLSVWRDHPFRPTAIAEDLEWGRDVLLAGYKLAYVPDAVVRHSHERSVWYELQRTYLVHQRLQTLFGLTTVPTMRSLARAIATSMPINARIAAREPRGRPQAILRGAALGVAQPLGQYLGARAARENRALLHPRGI
jgi:rhamnosyltransferase